MTHRAVSAGWVLLVLAAACRPAAEGGNSDASTDPTPGVPVIPEASLAGANVLVVSMDTTQAAMLGIYGADPSPSAELDALLEGGLVVDWHQSGASWTFPSASSFQTGRPTRDIGRHVFIPLTANGVVPLPGSEVLLSEVLAESGYAQALLRTSNENFGPDSGLADGFTDVAEYGNGQPGLDPVVSEVSAWITLQSNGTTPWFAWWHLNDAHWPYEAPNDYLECPGSARLPADIPVDYDTLDALERAWDSYDDPTQQQALDWLRCQYEGELRLDASYVARFFATEQAAGHLDNTLVVFLTDHGEAFMEHGRLGHSNTVFPEETRAALALLGPGIPPSRFAGYTDHADVAPTILSALGIDIPPTMTGVPVGTGAGRIVTSFSCNWHASALDTSTGRWAVSVPALDRLESFDLPTDPGALEADANVPASLAQTLEDLFQQAEEEAWCQDG